MLTNQRIITFFPDETDTGKIHSRLRVYVDEKEKYFFCKRLFDIVFSTLIIISVLSWLIPFLALLIRIDSRGPVFFLQRRVGRGGKGFFCLKMRTMIVNPEADVRQCDGNDFRITRMGFFLRITNFDELPQFFNVLYGDMSIVGPRPHMYADCNLFSSIISGYKFRNMVKPGITGMAQVKGYHGPAIEISHIFRRYQWDAFYIRNAGMLLDLRIMRTTFLQRLSIIIQTLFRGFSRKRISKN